jgi:hypothetical protein
LDLWKLHSFLVACNLHFQDCPYTFPDDEKKILFILSYLDGPAMSWFEPGLMGGLYSPPPIPGGILRIPQDSQESQE